MILEATQPLEINIDGTVYELDPGQSFDLPDDKAERARPFIEEGILRELKPVEEIDLFFSGTILPRLSRLHMAGRLPDLSTCPLWIGMESHWQTKSPGVAKVQGLMNAAVETYERFDSLFQ